MTRTVLITDAGRGSAIAFIRSLGAKGWHVIAADSDPRSAGFRSRFAHERHVYPSPQRSPRAFAQDLLELASRRKLDLIVPVIDECIHPLAHMRECFAGLTQLAIASERALAVTTDKQVTLELARSLGLSVPATHLVHTRAEVARAARELRFPLVIKPTVSRRYFPAQDRIEVGAVRFARDAAELGLRTNELGSERPLLLQEYEAGVGVGVECLAHEGRVLRAFQHERLAEIPVTGGASAWRVSRPLDEELLRRARALVAALGWTGLIMIEFKLGKEAWLLEINGRIWGSLPLACLAGVDFPGELAELYCPGESRPGESRPGESRPDGSRPDGSRPDGSRLAGSRPGADLLNGSHGNGTVDRAGREGSGALYRVGMRAYNLELMLSWIGQVFIGHAPNDYLPRPGRRAALAGLIGLLDPAQKSDLSGGFDPAPRLAEARRIVRKFAGKLMGGSRGRACRG